jgi:hypothetical protein
MKVNKVNDIFYPELEDWQKKAAENYFKMGRGAWPDDLHGLAYRITKRYGMCGDVMWEICKLYVWLRSQEFINYQEKKGNKVKPESIRVFVSKDTNHVEESSPLEFEEMWGFKDEVIKRWSNAKEV